MDNRYEIAGQNGMSREFADWFFDNKKAGCGNVWFMMMAAMWEGWEGRAAMLLGAENAESLHAVKDAPALDSSSRIAESLHADFQGADQAPVKQPSSNPIVGWLRADYQDDNRGLRGNAPLFVLGKKDPSSVWGLGYIPLIGALRLLPAAPQQDVK